VTRGGAAPPAGDPAGGRGPVLVKLCGTARAEDLRLACDLAADFVGFIFAESPRRARPSDVAAWKRDMPRLPRSVGVFVNASLAEIEEAVRVAVLDLVQLHGDETPEFSREAADIAPVVKAVRLAGPDSLAAIDRYAACHAILIEPEHPTLRGGAGAPLDLHVAMLAARRHRVFLAGGLRPDTVGDAVRAARPFAVDVASGVEAAPGRKDAALAARFVAAAREAAGGLARPPRPEPRTAR
jgi:phosphoribosylanthranilate isomerase